MTGRLPTLTARRVIAALERAGFVLAAVKGSHFKFTHPAKPRAVVTVPNHPGDLKRPLMKAIVKQAQLTEEEFAKLL